MISQKINVISSFNYISYRLRSFGTLVMKENSFFHSEFRRVTRRERGAGGR